MSFGNDWRLENTLNVKSSQGTSVDTELYKGLFHDKIGLKASISYDKSGFSMPSISASTGISTNIGGYDLGFNTSISDSSISVTPHLNFKLTDDISFNSNVSISTTEHNVSISTSHGLGYKMLPHFRFGIFFNTTHTPSHLLKLSCLILNFNLLGYNIKVPIFMATGKDMTDVKERIFTVGSLVLSAQVLGYMAYKAVRRFKAGKKYTSVDVDFRKYMEK